MRLMEVLYSFILYKKPVVEEQEVIELVPNIILNPGFEPLAAPSAPELPPDENSNSELAPLRLNNNTVVQPRSPPPIGFIL